MFGDKGQKCLGKVG